MTHWKLRTACRIAALVWCAAALPATVPVSRATDDIPTDPKTTNNIPEDALRLLHPSLLVGWDYPSSSPAGWSRQEGTLRGLPDAAPLLSGWTLGDFNLWIAFRGGLELRLPRAPSGEALQIRLREGEGCGELLDGGKPLEPGQTLAARPRHTAHLQRRGESLCFNVDGQLLWSVKVPAAQRYGLGLQPWQSAAEIFDLRLKEPPGKPIFNGRDTSGWWCPGNLQSWPVEDGELVCINRNGNYLRTEQEYENFTLSLEYKMRRGGNSGIGIRTPRSGWPSGDGMELQLLDQSPNAALSGSSTMAIYRNVEPIDRADRSEQWNRVVIKCDGPLVTAWVNGVLCQHVHTGRHPELKFRHPRGWIGFQDHGAWIRLRNIQVLEAPPGRGLDAWHAPPLMDGATVVADRLMNPKRLSQADGVRSAAVAGRLADNEPTTLARLEGPGAVVLVSGDGKAADANLEFFFDGEDKPRLKGKPGQLAFLPSSPGQWLTYIPYAQRLEVVGRSAGDAQVLLEYLTFPAEVVVESFTDRKTVLPRGVWAALDYRKDHHKYGTHREHDPLPRVRGTSPILEPGQSATLVEVPDAGLVEWLKLKAPSLAGDDLWLSVFVGAEKTPSLEAPARYFFPGLPGNYENYLVTDRDGFTSRLAIPYTGGLRVMVANRGQQPQRGISAAVSYQPLPADEAAARLALRGRFFRAGEPVHISAQPRGRLVAVVGGWSPPPEHEAIRLQTDHPPQPAGRLTWPLAALGPANPRGVLAGSQHGLTWRWLVPCPVEFEQSLAIDGVPGDCLLLYYGR